MVHQIPDSRHSLDITQQIDSRLNGCHAAYATSLLPVPPVSFYVMLFDVILHTFSAHPHTRPFSGPLSRTTQVSRHQKGKTNLDFTEGRDSEWH